MVGGSYPPFERFYTQPYQAVNQGPNHFPDDSFHIMVLTPSLLVDTKYIDARIAVHLQLLRLLDREFLVDQALQHLPARGFGLIGLQAALLLQHEVDLMDGDFFLVDFRGDLRRRLVFGGSAAGGERSHCEADRRQRQRAQCGRRGK